MNLREKFSPDRFRCSPKFHAVLGFILGERWTSPSLASLSITSDGFLVSGHNFLGTVSDLERNLTEVLDFVKCTPQQKVEFWKHYKNRISDFR